MPNFYKMLIPSPFMLCLAFAGFIAFPSATPAQDLLPPSATTQADKSIIVGTHPTLRLTPEKSQLIRLNKNAVSVVVGNPSHLSILMDTPQILVLIPRAPGATHFTVLDQQGEIIMQRHVIVAAPKENYIRIRRSCANSGEDSDCQATSVYFCPDMCHEVDVTQINEEIEQTDPPEKAPAGTSSSATSASPPSAPRLQEQPE